MTHYRLVYFNLNALAEPIRWLFKVAGVDFEDERFDRKDWEPLKESGRCPGKQVPLLEIDGTVYTQTNTILRHLGRKFNLVTDDELLTLRVDQVVDIISDGRAVFHRYFLHSYIDADPAKSEEVKQLLKTTVCPLVLQQINDIVSLTGHDGDFIAGSTLTWGDLVLANWLSIWESVVDPNLLVNFPALVKQKKAVLDLPRIKEWMEVRPQVPF